ncbi:MAG: hypothetical protein JXA36_05130 [Coriobacteriia bacterium]|nr:hypothetical protein [Coriobacteriia bacterium]
MKDVWSVSATSRSLRAFGEELAGLQAAQTGGSFTALPEADLLIRNSPEAFLLGVLFTQGISAERAWAGPYLLEQRLGHLDLRRLAVEEDAVAAAVAGPPALHRFVHTVPQWITSAARRLVSEYGGSAAEVWRPGSHVLDVTRRLLEFDGIGEKKAAMAVEILMRHFGVQLEGAECGSVAYDVHVRRVFLRTGMVDRDTPQAVREAARRACPESPGTLDLAAWLVGRDWCRPRAPLCDSCRLGGVCPRLTDRNAEGVGVRASQSSGRNSSPDSSLG